MRALNNLAVSFFCFFIPTHCLAQSYSEIEMIKQKYSGEKAIILKDLDNVTIEVQNNTYKITEDITKQTLLLDNTGKYFSTDHVYNSHFVNIKSIDAGTFIPDGNKFITKKVDKFVETSSQSESVFYDEVTRKSFVYPGVVPGAVTFLKFSREIKDPRMLNSFFFKWHVPCELSELSIKVDKKAGLRFKLYNCDSVPIVFSHVVKGRYEFFTWTAHHVTSSRLETDAPDARYYFPHVVYYIQNQNPADTSNINYKGINGLYNYYYSLIKNVNVHDDEKLREEVNKIVEGSKTEVEKVKRIFYWVQDHINYIAFEEGMQGFIPEEATQVYNKRYGDCKGMSSLMHEMLKMAGIKSYLTWIGTRDLPYKYSDIPSAIVDNHMIVTYYQNGKPVFLDGTSNYLPFGLPTAMIQGKQALVGISEQEYKIEEVPVVKNGENLYQDSCFLTIRNNSMEGSGILRLKGFEKTYKTYSLTGKDKVNIKENVLSILTRGSNKFFLDTFTINDLNERELPLILKYKYKLDDYFREIDGELYLNLNLNHPYLNAQIDPVKHPVPTEHDFSSTRKFTTVFEIPKGYQISYMPKNRTDSCNLLNFRITYRTEGNKVIQEKEVKDQYLLVEPADFNKWNEVIKSLNAAYRDVLILKKI